MILKKVHMKKRTSQFCTQSPSAGTVWCKLSCGVLCGPPRPESPIHFPLPVYMQSVARETTVFPYFFPFSETKSYGLPIFAPPSVNFSFQLFSLSLNASFPFVWTNSNAPQLNHTPIPSPAFSLSFLSPNISLPSFLSIARG